MPEPVKTIDALRKTLQAEYLGATYPESRMLGHMQGLLIALCIHLPGAEAHIAAHTAYLDRLREECA